MTTPTIGTTQDTTGNPVGTESSLSNWAGDYVTEMLGKGWALSDAPYQAYTGPLDAGIPSLLDQSFSGMAGLETPTGTGEAAGVAGDIAAGGWGTSYDPTTFSTSGYTPGQVSTGTYDPMQVSTGAFTDQGVASQYMNPYIQQALNPSLDEIRRQSEITRLNDASRLSQAGAYGGGRQAIMESELNDNMLRLMAERTGQGYADAFTRAGEMYQQDAGRQFDADRFNAQLGADVWGRDADRMLGADKFNEQLAADSFRDYADRDLQAQRYGEDSRQFGANLGLDQIKTQLDAARLQGQLSSDDFDNAMSLLSAQGKAGELERNILNEGIDKDRAQFEEERDYPYKQVQYMQSLLDGLPLEASQQFYQDPSLLSTILGGTGGVMQLIDILKGGGSAT